MSSLKEGNAMLSKNDFTYLKLLRVPNKFFHNPTIKWYGKIVSIECLKLNLLAAIKNLGFTRLTRLD